jgi:hypothetical protein
MNTKIIIGAAVIALLTVAIVPSLVNQASAKITQTPVTTCERPSGNVQDRPCPGASGTQGQSEEETCTRAVNPAGNPVPGQTTCD